MAHVDRQENGMFLAAIVFADDDCCERTVRDHLAGGFGFGTPVVSYPPRPMSQGVELDDEDVVVIVSRCESC